MRHKINHRKLNRTSSHRKAMMINMASSLILHEQINTTLPKAKEIRPYVEKLVSLAKKLTKEQDHLAKIRHRRVLLSKLRNDKKIADKLLDVFAKRYANRNGGYLRIIKAGFRQGDSAPMSYIQFVDRAIEQK